MYMCIFITAESEVRFHRPIGPEHCGQVLLLVVVRATPSFKGLAE